MINSTKSIPLTIILLTVISFALKAQTNVSGGIYSDVTWTKANSPYIVTDTVVVFPGHTLTIEPGVVIKFYNNIPLIISSATLIANGTALDSITFTSNSSSPTVGIWSGLKFNSDTAISLNYCNIFYGTSNGLGFAKRVTIKNSTFNYNGGWALWITGLGNLGDIIDSCVFKFNWSGLIASKIGVSNCYASNNSGAGINASGIDIISNCISDSNWTGIQDGGQIINCICNNNSRVGIELTNSALVQNCTINSNKVGISIENYSTGSKIINCQVRYNNIGITDTTSGNQANISMSDIENNSVGLKIISSVDSIYCNKICNNSSYDFYYWGGSTSSTNIAGNYWCSTDSTTIASHIYDGYDNVSYGLVSFMPIDTVGCYLTGCNIHLTTTVTNATCDTCHNGSATANISYGHPNYTYTWQTSPIQTTQTATKLASGTYTVCVSDGNGCTACASVFVDSSNCTGFSVKAHATHASCTSCADGKAWVDVTKGTSPYTYLWIPFGFAQALDSNLTPGFYQICATDLYGCVACDTVTIGVGACSAHFDLYPDKTTPHLYTAVNMAFGSGPLTYDWNWGDGSAHDNTPFPNHTYAAAGLYNICLTIADTAGCTDTYCNSFVLQRTTNTMIRVNVVPSLPTGINEGISNASMYIFPNPASDNLTLVLPENVSNGSLRIFDLLGKIQYTSAIAKQETNMDVSTLASGIYILEVSYGDTIRRQKFVRE